MPPLLLILVALATYRVTHLFTADKITKRVREWAIAKSNFTEYLVDCDWCLSIWVAPIPAALVVMFPTNRVVLVGLVALSASAITGLLSTVEDKLNS